MSFKDYLNRDKTDTILNENFNKEIAMISELFLVSVGSKKQEDIIDKIKDIIDWDSLEVIGEDEKQKISEHVYWDVYNNIKLNLNNFVSQSLNTWTKPKE